MKIEHGKYFSQIQEEKREEAARNTEGLINQVRNIGDQWVNADTTRGMSYDDIVAAFTKVDTNLKGVITGVEVRSPGDDIPEEALARLREKAAEDKSKK